MKISHDKAVSFDFTLTDEHGNVLDTSVGKFPFTYLHGYGMVVPGLERALEGRSAGESFDVTVPPEAAYGLRDEENQMAYERDEFEDDELVIGNQLYIMGMNGMRRAVVLSFDDKQVVMDTNHELAGKTLHYDVKILGIRDSTFSERMCGHVHDPIDAEA